MEYTYAIVVSVTEMPVSALMKVKKLTHLSLADIKARVASRSPLYECNCSDECGMVLLLALFNALDSEGIEPVFLDCGESAPIQYLRNALESYRRISEQEND